MPGQSRTSSTSTSSSSGPSASSTPALDSNHDTAQDLGLGGGEVCEPSAPEAQLPAPSGPYVVLERGAEASEDAVPGWQMVVETHLSGWGLGFDDSRVLLADVGAASETCEPIIALLWNAQWGNLPVTVDMPPSLSPLSAKVSVTLAQASDGWASLSADEQRQVSAVLGGETNGLSEAARAHVQTFVGDSGWASQPASVQADVLREAVTSDSARPALVDDPHADVEPAAHTLAGPTVETGHAFRGVVADADVWTVTFTEGGQTVTIYAPHAPDPAQGHHYTVQQAVHALVRLPDANRAVVTAVNLNAVANPEDAYWAVEYDDPNFESFMTAGADGVVDIYPSQGDGMSQTYTDDTMVHETGHTWSQQTWGEDTSGAAWQPWRDAMASDGASVSNYATASIDEDVAETVQVYATNKGTPKHDEYRAIVPARFAILDRHF